jgi:hypothetical protein
MGISFLEVVLGGGLFLALAAHDDDADEHQTSESRD